ncbi:hypothetical protein P171DRAFT_444898 [Karstenula rhodostoma CBS 690.94]|uniref:Uncharacterized protein n=1 Tax=Karstenula rhodostoma CBS 690.94 TaxID=1392251 RepID=A0A9P4PEC4_9PLEO|nr:hypothetical protein P171DRAFT_444898 [Karstenula rhodostoma CBS 690.94]
MDPCFSMRMSMDCVPLGCQNSDDNSECLLLAGQTAVYVEVWGFVWSLKLWGDSYMECPSPWHNLAKLDIMLAACGPKKSILRLICGRRVVPRSRQQEGYRAFRLETKIVRIDPLVHAPVAPPRSTEDVRKAELEAKLEEIMDGCPPIREGDPYIHITGKEKRHTEARKQLTQELFKELDMRCRARRRFKVEHDITWMEPNQYRVYDNVTTGGT